MSSIDTRNLERDSLFLMAELVFDHGGAPVALTVKVRNLSSRGMMIESDQRLECGTRVAVELRNIGAVAGTVMWKKAARLGIAFDEEIDPRMARRPVYGGAKEAPVYARSPVEPPRHDGWQGKLRPV